MRLSRREFLAALGAAGAAVGLPGPVAAAAAPGRRLFLSKLTNTHE